MIDFTAPDLLGGEAERQKLVDTDLGALADQLDRCTHQSGRTGEAQQRLNAALGFMQRHIVTLVVLLALLAAAISLRG